MRSDAATVGEYIAAAPEDRREALRLLQRLCREELTGFEEAMRYGMPGYLRGGEVEVGFASQKQYLALYILREGVIEDHAARFTGLSRGKGCIRFRRPGQIDPDTVRALLAAVVTADGPLC
jgi:uncharacterized protein YdhG (YjbR/CyaY superfamily)